MTTADRIEAELRTLASPEQIDLIAKRVPRDQVIGVRMKLIFDLAKANKRLDLDVVRELIRSRWYEMRMVAVSILDARARLSKPESPDRQALYDLYRAEHAHIDTWDLVDRAAPRVIGEHLLDRPRDPLFALARSANPWERRTAIVACFWIIRHGDPADPVAVLEILADDPEVFVQSALGTAVRELRRADPEVAARFESAHPLSPAARRAARVGRS
jgi:3-methyladenine DNA glycosylase AlkD